MVAVKPNERESKEKKRTSSHTGRKEWASTEEADAAAGAVYRKNIASQRELASLAGREKLENFVLVTLGGV